MTDVLPFVPGVVAPEARPVCQQTAFSTPTGDSYELQH